MELDHAAVDRGIEIAADKDEHHGAEREQQDGENRDDGAAGQQNCEQPNIALAQPLEAALERRVETGEEAPAVGIARVIIVMLDPSGSGRL
jgi:hypothetical protein